MASLLLTLLFVCGVCHAGPAPLHYVPSDARPGHVVAVLPAGPGGQLYRIAPALARAHLLVTGSGELITSSRVAHLAGQTLTVHIERESAGDTPRLTLRLHVRLPSPDTHPFVGGASAPRGRPEGVARRVRRAASTDGARVFVVRRTLSGALFSVGRGVLGERFMFGEVGAPHLAGLVLQPDTGLVQRSAAHRWLPDLLQLHFTVNVTRPLQPHYAAELLVVVHLVDRTAYSPVFTNEPRPLRTTVAPWVRPGTVVLTLSAIDSVRYAAKVSYRLESGAAGRFTVDADSGEVAVSGRQRFQPGSVFEVSVSAAVVGMAAQAVTLAQVVSVHVGDLVPQFYASPRYVIDVAESTPTATSVAVIKAKSFQALALHYTLESVSGVDVPFHIHPDSGVLSLTRGLRYVFEAHQYHLTVRAGEAASGLQAVTDVIVNLTPVNRNAPYFALEKYVALDINEMLPVDSLVMTLTATDLDEGDNGMMTFNCSDDHFVVTTTDGKVASLMVNKRLDYDGQPEHKYSVRVTATDGGGLTATADVDVYMANENDEAPVMAPPVQSVRVKDVALRSMLVVSVQAYDPDGDRLTFSIAKSEPRVSAAVFPFEIDRNTGHISLNKSLSVSQPNYNLTIAVTDDGSCCSSQRGARHTTLGYVVIRFIGVNHSPRFSNCPTTSNDVMVKEEMRNETSVFNISATDPDSGSNGELSFSVVIRKHLEQPLFGVRQAGGMPRVAELYTLKRFQREVPFAEALLIGGQVRYKVTLRVDDHGDYPLSATCFFFVTIKDVNNHAPVFDYTVYEATVLLSAAQGARVVRVFAIDDDEGLNAAVSYSIVSSGDCGDCFNLDPQSGWLTVMGQLKEGQFELRLVATDGGVPPQSSQVGVAVRVTSEPSELAPRLEPEPPDGVSLDDLTLSVWENMAIGAALDLQLAVLPLGDGSMPLRALADGRTEQENLRSKYFQLVYVNEQRVQVVLGDTPLSYERVSRFYLKFTVTNPIPQRPLVRVSRLTLDIRDVNNRIPVFEGLDSNGNYPAAVSETTAAGDFVLVVQAFDQDGTSPNNQVSYRWNATCHDCPAFHIDAVTGVITARQTYQRVVKTLYRLIVIAEDGAPSSIREDGKANFVRAYVIVKVMGLSQFPPRFSHPSYEHVTEEGKPLGTTIATVTAASEDTGNIIQYSLIGGNEAMKFGVDSDSGRIYIQGETLYNDQPVYNLKLRAFDGGADADTTIVIITLTSTNMFAPVFSPLTTTVTSLKEGELPPGGALIQVSATDGDVSRQLRGALLYSVAGVHSHLFSVTRDTGHVSLKQPLSRDVPDGHASWLVNVVATDEGGATGSRRGYGVLQLRLMDTNDNTPVFDTCCLEGHVDESRSPDSPRLVMTIRATDVDEGRNGFVLFDLLDLQGKFSLGSAPTAGSVQLMTTGRPLVRLEEDRYVLSVRAYDEGQPPREVFQNITVIIDDIDNHAPRFETTVFSATVPEELAVGSSVVAVSASEKDIGQNAERTYEILAADADGRFFMVDSVHAAGTGVVKMKKSIDYDGDAQHGFAFRVTARDTDTSHPIATATVSVTITDINDNTPKLAPRELTLQLAENVAVDTLLATFTAEDIDSGRNAQFEFFVDYAATDERKRFVIGRVSGELRVRAALDREVVSSHLLHILAIDKGEPAQTGTAVVTLNLTDINDNAPVVVGGGAGRTDAFVVRRGDRLGARIGVIKATDVDTADNGPPFEFSLACADGAGCDDFTLESGPSGTSAVLTAARSDGYSRAAIGRTAYSLTVTAADSPASGQQGLTGTATITVVIESSNDHDHTPGHLAIDVCRLKGGRVAAPLPLATPFAEDEDDWDIKDKSFKFIGKHDGFTLEDHQLMLLPSARGEHHQLQVSVTDGVRGNREVISTVSVNVLYIEEAVARAAGSVRLQGLTASQFVSSPRSGVSRWTRFRASVAALLHTNTTSVHVIGLREAAGGSLDVWFIGHGSPWYYTSRLNGLVWANKDKVSAAAGADLVMSPVSGCAAPVGVSGCWQAAGGGGCSDSVHLDSQQVLVVQTNRSVFVGLGLRVRTACACEAERASPAHCTPGLCLHDATCTDTTTGFKCLCAAGFDGPRCQQTRQSFSGGGWAWYEPLSSCDNAKTSFEFLTSEENGLLLYNGPMSDDDVTRDYVAMELSAGLVRARVDLGGGEVILQVEGQKLNDAKWHTVELYKTVEALGTQQLRLVVDHCDTSLITEDIRESTEQRSTCEDVRPLRGEEVTLDVNTPLELGGRSNPGVSRPARLADGFTGCIKALRHNGRLYDLHVGAQGESSNTKDGCAAEDAACTGCGAHKLCDGSPGHVTSCACPAGLMGPECNQSVPVRDLLTAQSYMEWQLSAAFNASRSPRSFSLQLMVRTRQEDGVIFSADSFSTLERIRLEVRESRVQFRYDLGSGDRVIALTGVNISDGAWHVVSVSRHAHQVELWVDGGEGRMRVERDDRDGHRLVAVDGRRVNAGAEVTYRKYTSEPTRTRGLANSCMKDIRYDGGVLPLTLRGRNNVATVTSLVATRDTCLSAACVSVVCPRSFICTDVWRQHQCVCPVGQKPLPLETRCVLLTDCSVARCLHGDCYLTVDSWACRCERGWTGRNCSTPVVGRPVTAAATASSAMIAIIVVCLILLLLAVLLVAVYMRRRKKPKQLLPVDPDDDVRENVGFYDEEGAGEEDVQGYDLSRLQKPLDTDADSLTKPPFSDGLPTHLTPTHTSDTAERPRPPDVADFIDDRLRDADDQPLDADSPLVFDYEGAGSDATSLSSLATSGTGSSADFDYLNDFGPRFRRLADMYGGGQSDEEDASVV